MSELAANAIVHSASRGAFFTVRAELHAHYVWVEAEDLGGPWHCRPPTAFARIAGLDAADVIVTDTDIAAVHRREVSVTGATLHVV